MKKITLALIATILFGKLFPVILLALIVVGAVMILKASVEEGKQW